MYTCIYICIYTSIYILVYTCVFVQVYTYLHKHTYIKVTWGSWPFISLLFATHSKSLQHTVTRCNTHSTHCNATHRNTPQHTLENLYRSDSLFLRPTTAHCDTLQYTAIHCNTLQHIATHCSTLQYTARHCNTLQNTCNEAWDSQLTLSDLVSNAIWHTDTETHRHAGTHTHRHMNTKETQRHRETETQTHGHTATHCNTLQCTATHYNALQHTATRKRLTSSDLDSEATCPSRLQASNNASISSYIKKKRTEENINATPRPRIQRPPLLLHWKKIEDDVNLTPRPWIQEVEKIGLSKNARISSYIKKA